MFWHKRTCDKTNICHISMPGRPVCFLLSVILDSSISNTFSFHFGVMKISFMAAHNPGRAPFRFFVGTSVSLMGSLPSVICCSNLFLIFESCLTFYLKSVSYTHLTL